MNGRSASHIRTCCGGELRGRLRRFQSAVILKALPGPPARATDDPNGGFPLCAVGIRRFNLASGEDTRIYQGGEDAFSIGRMFALADKDVLVFSQIPNLQDWIAALPQAGSIQMARPTRIQNKSRPFR